MRITVAVLTTGARSDALDACLGAIAALAAPEGATLRTLVVQNGREAPDGAALGPAADAFAPGALDVAAEPRRGIPFARNAAIDRAAADGATHLAFIDDDAYPDADWLTRLSAEMGKTGAEAASGPQAPVFPEDAPLHLRGAEIYRERRLSQGALCDWAATNNVMFSLAFVQERGLRFNEDLRTGGSDKEFFLRFTRAGGRIVWAADAVVREPVIAERLDAAWATRRAYRYGSTGYSIESAIRPAPLAALICVAKGGYYVLSGLARLPAAALAPESPAWIDGRCRLAHGAGFFLGMSQAFRPRRYA